jgi:outer membrane protein assembly factor BamB
MLNSRRFLVTCLLLFVFLAPIRGEEETEFFRKAGGVVPDGQHLPGDFTKDAMLLWRTPLKPGHSSPCVVGDHIFLTTFDAGKKELATIALERTSGEVLWTRIVETETIEAFHRAGSPAASTPASNGKQVFVFFGSYGLLCYDFSGKLLWEKKLGPFQDEFGASSSPVLVNDLIVLNEDHDVNSYLIAIDQKTGKTVWREPRDEQARSYSTPVIWSRGGDNNTEIIVAGSLQLAAYDATSGKKVWWVNGLSRIVDSTPVVTKDAIYLATWTPGGDVSERIKMEPFDEAIADMDKNKDNKISKNELPAGSPVIPRFFRMDLDQDQSLNQKEWERHAGVFAKAQNVAMSVRPGGRGDVTSTHVRWIVRRGLPTVPSSTVYDGVLYMVKDSGIITSLDIDTGEILQQGRAEGSGNYYASLVAGDGKVYLTSERGVITVLRASRSWTVLSSHDFEERIVATPVAKQQTFFVRTEEALYAFRKR